MPHKEENPGAHAGATEAYQEQVDPQSVVAVEERQAPFRLWPWLDRIAHDRALPPQAARFAICIAAMRGKDGVARFKVDELAETMGTVYATAYTTMRALLDGGYLAGAGVRNRGCAFTLAMPDGKGNRPLEGGPV